MNEMTNDEIRLAILKAKGYEKVVAIDVVGDFWEHLIPSNDPDCFGETEFLSKKQLPGWPTDIAAACELIQECPHVVEIFKSLVQTPPFWIVTIFDGDNKYSDSASALERAICLAWLSWKAAK
jgi:hypothetical protein